MELNTGDTSFSGRELENDTVKGDSIDAGLLPLGVGFHTLTRTLRPGQRCC